MNKREFLVRLRQVCARALPDPGAGETAVRHLLLSEIGREDLSLARMAEAHHDAVAILAEAGRKPQPGALYGVWAAEGPQATVKLTEDARGELLVNGTKNFCSGAGLIDRALVTVDAPDPWLVDVDLHHGPDQIHIDTSGWKSPAFALTNTAAVTLTSLPVCAEDVIGERGWYLRRPGFWHGACGPAACWAGGAAGILDYSREQARSDSHTMAHLGAMESAVWSMRAVLEVAGREIDTNPHDHAAAHIRALSVRHSVEQRCMEVLERFGRAYGPYPFAFCEAMGRRSQELTIYLRQCHAERDLEALGRAAAEHLAILDPPRRREPWV